MLPRLMRRAVLPVLAVAALAAGCGTNSAPEAPSGSGPGSGGSDLLVPMTDVARVVQAMDVINQLCDGHPLDTGPPVGGTGKPSPQAIDAAVTILRTVYADGPQHIFEWGGSGRAESMTNLLRRQAVRLQSCGAPQAAARLRRTIGQA